MRGHITARPLRGPRHPQSGERRSLRPVTQRDRAGLGARGAGSTGNSAPRGERLWDTGLYSAAGCSPDTLRVPIHVACPHPPRGRESPRRVPGAGGDGSVRHPLAPTPAAGARLHAATRPAVITEDFRGFAFFPAHAWETAFTISQSLRKKLSARTAVPGELRGQTGPIGPGSGSPALRAEPAQCCCPEVPQLGGGSSLPCPCVVPSPSTGTAGL